LGELVYIPTKEA